MIQGASVLFKRWLESEGLDPSVVEYDAPQEGVVLLVGAGRTTASLAQALEERGPRVVTFWRYSSALREAGRILPDTVLVGTDPTAGDPLRFLHGLGRIGCDAFKIVLAERHDPAEVDLALAAGAHDVLAPPHSAAAILMRRRVMAQQGRTSRPDRALRRRVALGQLVVDLNSRQVLDGAEPLTLSGREFELLVRLMEARGGVVSRDDLLRDIWGEDQGSEAVLDATVHRLRRKLDEKGPSAGLVSTVRGVGYRLEAAFESVEDPFDTPVLQG